MLHAPTTGTATALACYDIQRDQSRISRRPDLTAGRGRGFGRRNRHQPSPATALRAIRATRTARKAQGHFRRLPTSPTPRVQLGITPWGFRPTRSQCYPQRYWPSRAVTASRDEGRRGRRDHVGFPERQGSATKDGKGYRHRDPQRHQAAPPQATTRWPADIARKSKKNDKARRLMTVPETSPLIARPSRSWLRHLRRSGRGATSRHGMVRRLCSIHWSGCRSLPEPPEGAIRHEGRYHDHAASPARIGSRPADRACPRGGTPVCVGAATGRSPAGCPAWRGMTRADDPDRDRRDSCAASEVDDA